MKEQKVLFASTASEINNLIDKGWVVVSIVAQHVSSSDYPARGYFLILFEREKSGLKSGL